MKDKAKVIVFHESILSSMVKDTWSFTILISSLYLSVNYLGNHWYINVPVVLISFLALGTKRSSGIKTFYSKDEARAYINSEKF